MKVKKIIVCIFDMITYIFVFSLSVFACLFILYKYSYANTYIFDKPEIIDVTSGDYLKIVEADKPVDLYFSSSDYFSININNDLKDIQAKLNLDGVYEINLTGYQYYEITFRSYAKLLINSKDSVKIEKHLTKRELFIFCWIILVIFGYFPTILYYSLSENHKT